MVRALVDTHVLLWWALEPHHLSPRARSVLADEMNDLYWSAASTWELAIKAARRGLELPSSTGTYIPMVLDREGLRELPVTGVVAARVEHLPLHHKDPFDRLIIAQAQAEGLAIITADRIMSAYNVEVIW